MGLNTLTIPSKYTTPVGYRKDGRPIYLIAGGVDDPENPVPASPNSLDNPNPPAQAGDEVFTKADVQAAIEKARKEEKDKVYGRLDSLQTQLSEWEKREQERQAAEEAAAKRAEEEARRKEEENLSAKELLARKEQEWQSQIESVRQEQERRLAELQQEREQERALLEKERQFASLQAFTQQRLAEEQENIAPELLDFVSGNTQEEIEQSIAAVKAKSQAIAEQARAALQQARSQQRGVSSTGYAPVGPLDLEGGTRQYSAADIANMDINEYAKFRQSVPGLTHGTSSNRGLFG